MSTRWKFGKRMALPGLLLALFLSSFAAAAAAAEREETLAGLYLGETEIRTEVAPVLRDYTVYIEFRGLMQAMGIPIGYNVAKRWVTAESGHAAFKLNLKTGEAHVNGRSVFQESGPAVIFVKGRTLVSEHVLTASGNIGLIFDEDTRIVRVLDLLRSKPTESDLQEIRSVIEEDNRTVSDAATVTDIRLVSWDTYVTVEVEVDVPKSGDELLDRIFRGTVLMERDEGNNWSIYDSMSDGIEYVDYLSLADREADVPEADKAAILGVFEDGVKAANEENAAAAAALLLEDTLYNGISLRKWMQDIYERAYAAADVQVEPEQAVIVKYAPEEATVYCVQLERIRTDEEAYSVRHYLLRTFVKADDGKWYLDAQKIVYLDNEFISDP